jgi:AcrR family transcriptional regulator
MGRKFLDKSRSDDQALKLRWAGQLMPLFLERGLKSFRMDDVAAELGVSKATLYKHFRSREEILDLALLLKLADIRRYQAKLTDPNLSYLERFLEALHLASSELTAISTNFLADLSTMHPRVFERVRHFMNESLGALGAFYEEGIQRGELVPVPAAVLVLTDELYFSKLADPEFLQSRGLTVQEALDAYFLLKFGGMFRRPLRDAPEVAPLLARWLNKGPS